MKVAAKRPASTLVSGVGPARIRKAASWPSSWAIWKKVVVPSPIATSALRMTTPTTVSLTADSLGPPRTT